MALVLFSVAIPLLYGQERYAAPAVEQSQTQSQDETIKDLKEAQRVLQQQLANTNRANVKQYNELRRLLKESNRKLNKLKEAEANRKATDELERQAYQREAALQAQQFKDLKQTASRHLRAVLLAIVLIGGLSGAGFILLGIVVKWTREGRNTTEASRKDQQLTNPDLPTIRTERDLIHKLEVPYILELMADPEHGHLEEGLFKCKAVFQSFDPPETPEVLFPNGDRVAWRNQRHHAADIARKARMVGRAMDETPYSQLMQ